MGLLKKPVAFEFDSFFKVTSELSNQLVQQLNVIYQQANGEWHIFSEKPKIDFLSITKDTIEG